MYTLIENYIQLTKEERQKHLALSESCLEIGGDSPQFRGLLAYFLKTTIPKGHQAYLCHACHNGKCSNPRHLYWGTPSDNVNDAYQNGKISHTKGKACLE